MDGSGFTYLSTGLIPGLKPRGAVYPYRSSDESVFNKYSPDLIPRIVLVIKDKMVNQRIIMIKFRSKKVQSSPLHKPSFLYL